MPLRQNDPELLRQLDDAARSGESVQAVVKLHRTAGKAPSPSVVEEQTRRAVDRAAATTGEQPDDVHVLGRLATAYVSGSEKFLREFVEQPEVASAVANQSSPSAGAAPGPANGTAGGPPSGTAGDTPSGGGVSSGRGLRSLPLRVVPDS